MPDLCCRWWFRVLLVACVTAIHVHLALSGTTPSEVRIESGYVSQTAGDHEDSRPGEGPTNEH
jgi:hypothetical protein